MYMYGGKSTILEWRQQVRLKMAATSEARMRDERGAVTRFLKCQSNVFKLKEDGGRLQNWCLHSSRIVKAQSWGITWLEEQLSTEKLSVIYMKPIIKLKKTPHLFSSGVCCCNI